MKRILAFTLLAAFAVPIIAGCAEEKMNVDSSNAPEMKVDSSAAGKKGAMENDKGLTN